MDLRYVVHQNFFAIEGAPNEEIFILCGVLKIKFCRLFYGYPTHSILYSGYFPEYRKDDYSAAYRLAVALFALCDGLKKKDVVKLTTEKGEVIEISRKTLTELQKIRL